jgi:glycosyltransferase involved in cell wall biosynthesis
MLYVGDLHTFKGIATLLKGLRLYLDAGHEAYLLLVGSQYPVDNDWIDERIAAFGVKDHVERTGRVSRDVLTHSYREADLLVFPSFHEGSPRVVKEALSCGCPVIATDIPGVRIIDPDARAVRYFEAGNADQLVELLSAAEGWPADRRDYTRLAGEVVAEFTPDKIALKFAELYDTLWS